MKTEMSIPNPLYEQSQRLAQQLEMPLSELFLAAIKDYIDQYQANDVTRQLNQVYETEDAAFNPGFAHLQMISIGQETW